ncbi:MAG: hypothetical protein A3B37_03740 [Candidatus Sungbacteria bacterium RIFCSPLOWO2_01_FULL_59_16]|uniref:Uncharacterized protein n=1 Tax=Candidatus Sungbacteria bacterium RIFCSPLOWO2_01_FULL_59_16 TaxID=1802280 RepID=A0A1G2LC22_9BACT|nr:MAG: hypothetical protein A3B37_03740 [Candidatus Sungbacteria bacterium RIFCSPLOWO2_01_FULL_59_16]
MSCSNVAKKAAASRFAQKGMAYSATRLAPHTEVFNGDSLCCCRGDIGAGCSYFFRKYFVKLVFS